MIEPVGVPRGDMEGNVVDAKELAPSGEGNASSVEASRARRTIEPRDSRLLVGDCGAPV